MVDKKTRDVVRPNVVDGIEEYDNPLPGWWVWLFNGTIVFGLFYLIWFHLLDKPSLVQELAQDRQKYEQKVAGGEQGGATSAEDLATLIKDPKRIEEGRAVFASNCAPCHGQLGEGTVGPNLTDPFWIHGGKPEQIQATVTQGVPALGMIAWGPILGVEKINSVVAYVLSLQGTNPPNPKAPQGEAN